MNEYPKIETIFDRGEDFAVIQGAYRIPAFDQVRKWLVTEKVDGTNIRLSLQCDDGKWQRRIQGRTASAQIPASLFEALDQAFPVEHLQLAWGSHDPAPFTLYGEGYGAKIQGGGGYRTDAGFRLFDVLIDGKWWQPWDEVRAVADRLGIQTVPQIANKLQFLLGTPLMETGEIVDMVRMGFPSEAVTTGVGCAAEGVVARTDPYLFDAQGFPIRWKLKTKDFKPGKR